jgi:hypothetical protein
MAHFISISMSLCSNIRCHSIGFVIRTIILAIDVFINSNWMNQNRRYRNLTSESFSVEIHSWVVFLNRFSLSSTSPLLNLRHQTFWKILPWKLLRSDFETTNETNCTNKGSSQPLETNDTCSTLAAKTSRVNFCCDKQKQVHARMEVTEREISWSEALIEDSFSSFIELQPSRKFTWDCGSILYDINSVSLQTSFKSFEKKKHCFRPPVLSLIIVEPPDQTVVTECSRRVSASVSNSKKSW